jgi:hypothetical protein
VRPSPLTQRIDRWRIELKGDGDEYFVLNGLINGFKITDSMRNSNGRFIEVPNCASAINNHDIAETLINAELAEGNYIKVNQQPDIVSALGIVPKADGSHRLTHDLSRPIGCAVNDMASKVPFQYDTISDAINMIKPGWFLAKVDLKSAYRGVALHPG